jgi:RNase P/RNase MRP subunit p29
MNEENNYNFAIHTFATDKIQAKLINLMFSIEDAKKQLRTGIYGGVTKEEMEMVLDSEKREQEIYEYILDALDQAADKTR